MASELQENESIPQWKKDLIQRRRQHFKNNIFVCNKNGHSDNGVDINNKKSNSIECQKEIVEEEVKGSNLSVAIDDVSGRNEWELKRTVANPSCFADSVNCKMRLDVDYTDESSKFTPKNVNKCITNNINCFQNMLDNKNNQNDFNNDNDEFEYGPGIVKKLKSKYLNLTLHQNEIIKKDVTIRRATSLENLLESKQNDNHENQINHFTKRISNQLTNNNTTSNIKNQHLRSGFRIKERMKRARSVETLIRFQSTTADDTAVNGKLLLNSNNINQDVLNDSVFVIEKTNNLKIDCKLGDDERPKAINKPKRLKPVLVDNERPPPDVVKMNLRIFEGSIKKIKPKGDVAAKVATFKTINDNNKVLNIKKKPPIQPKTFLNTKITNQILCKKSTITNNIPAKQIIKTDVAYLEEIKCPDGVVNEPIVQSVSLVVSKFQQIEKSLSPTPTSTPTSSLEQCRNSKSPTASPEPVHFKFKPQLTTAISIKEETIISTLELSQDLNIVENVVVNDDKNDEIVEVNETKELLQHVDNQQPHCSDQIDSPKKIDKKVLENISKAGSTFQFQFTDNSVANKKYLPVINKKETFNNIEITKLPIDNQQSLINNEQTEIIPEIKSLSLNSNLTIPKIIKKVKTNDINQPQKQIGIIRPLQASKCQLSNREIEKNLINRVKSIETPAKVFVNLNNSNDDEDIEVIKKNGNATSTLWEPKPYNQQGNTMVFNFSNRKEVPDYIENDGIIIRRKRDHSKITEDGVIVLDATLDASTTDDIDWESSGGPPSPCDVSFLNDNIIINGRSNLSKASKNHKFRIQFDDKATRTFEYPSEISVLEDESINVGNVDESDCSGNTHPISLANNFNIKPGNGTNPILSSGGLANFTPSKVDLVSECFELGVTRSSTSKAVEQCNQQQQLQLPSQSPQTQHTQPQEQSISIDSSEVPSENNRWGLEPTADILY